jgi:hypothetical protein
MAKVLLGDLDGHPAGDRVARMRVHHPVRAGLGESLGTLRVASPSQHAGAAIEEAFDLVVERGCCDPMPRVEHLPGPQPRRALSRVACIAEQDRPLVADVLRFIGLRPTLDGVRAEGPEPLTQLAEARYSVKMPAQRTCCPQRRTL